MVIRPARPAECGALGELACRAKAHWGYDEAFMAACAQELMVDPAQLDAEHVRVALDDQGSLLGFYALALGADGGAELTMLFVDPPAIGTGVGAGLMAHCARLARSLGVTALRIEADPFAVGFYEHLGARQMGRVASGSIPGRSLPLLELALEGGVVRPGG